MADNKIKIEIQADVSGVKSGSEQAKVSLEKINNSVAELGKQADKTSDKLDGIAQSIDKSGEKTKESGSLFKSFAGGALSSFNLLLTVFVYLSKSFDDLKARGVPVFYAIGLTVLKARENIKTLIADLKVLITDLKALDFKKAGVDALKVGGDFRKLTLDIVNWKNISLASFEALHKVAEKLGSTLVKVGKFFIDRQHNQIKQDVQDSAEGFIARTLVTGVASKAAVDFEKSFTEVRKVLNGSDEDIAKVDKSLRKLATDVIPLTYEELAQIAAAGASMGMTASDIEPFIKAVAEAATAFGMTSDEAGQAFGKLKNIYGLTTDELALLSDQLNYVADNAPGSVVERDLIAVLQRMGEVGKGFGLLRGQSISLASALMVTGDAPEVISTALVQLLTRLQTTENQTDDFKAGLTALGLTAEGLSSSIKTDANTALDDFLAKLSSLNSQSRANIIGAMFGTGGDAVAIGKLVGQLETYRQLNKTAGDASLYAGSSHKAFVKQQETSQSKITMLNSALKTMGAALTEPIIPALNAVSENVKRVFSQLTDFASANPFAIITAQAIGLTTSFAAITRLISFFFSGLAAKILLATTGAATWAGAMALISARLASFGISIAAAGGFFARAALSVGVLGRALLFLVGGPIGLAITAVIALYSAWEKYKTKVVEVAGQHATLEQVVKASFSVMYNQAADFVRNVSAEFDSLVSKINTSWEQITANTKSWLDKMQADDDSYIGAVLRGRQALIDYLVNKSEENANKPSFFEKMGKKSERQTTFETAVATELIKQQQQPAAPIKPEQKADNSGLEVELPKKQDAANKTTNAALDLQLQKIKDIQEAKKRAADLETKQLENSFNESVFNLQKQLVSNLITEQEFNAKQLDLKNKLEADKLAIKKQALLDDYALEKQSLQLKLDAQDKEIAASEDKTVKAMAFFRAQGWTANQAAGIAANLQHESGFNTKAVGDSGKAKGIGQWHPDRQALFTSQFNKPIEQASFEEQLKFVQYELTHNEALAGKKLSGAGSAEQAGAIVSKFYERPADTAGEMSKRGKTAEQLVASNAKTDELNQQLIALEKKKNDELKALGLDAQATATEQSKVALDLKKENLDKQKEFNQESLQAEHAAALDALDIKEAQSQFELDAGLITQEQQLERLRQFASERYQIELDLLNKKMALMDVESLAYQQALNQKDALYRDYQATVNGLLNKEALQQKAADKEQFQPLESAIDSAVNSVLQGTQTLKQAAQKAAQSIILSYAQSFIKKRLMMVAEFAWEKIQLGAHWLWEAMGFGAKETVKAGAKVASETVQTAAVATGTAARSGIEKAASATSRIGKAWDAASGAFKSVWEAVPFPFNVVLAPVVAAAAFAGTMAFGSAKGGDYEVKKDGQLYQLHKQEMVLPAHLAEPLRNLIDSGQFNNWSLPQAIANIPQSAQKTAESYARDQLTATKKRATFAEEIENGFSGKTANQSAATSAGQVNNHYTIQAIDPIAFEKYLEKHGGNAITKIAEKHARNFTGGKR